MGRAPLRPDIPTLTSSAVPGALPVLPEAPTGAPLSGAMLGLAERIGGLQARVEQTLAAQAQEQAREQGTVAGAAQPGVRMEGGGVIFRSAFNAAAVDSGARQLELQARTRLSELDREHPADPAAFGAKASAFRDGIMAGLPEGVLRTRFAQLYDGLALPHLDRVRAAQEKRVADQSLASYDALREPRLAALAAAGTATATATDRQAPARLAAEQDRLLGDLVRLGPREAFVLDGRQYPADPTRTGALSVVQMQAEVGRVHRTARRAVLWGQWKAGPQTEAWIDDFEARELGHGPRLAEWIGGQAGGGRAVASPAALAARVPEAWKPIVVAAARAQNIPEGLALALIGLESGGRADAASPAGAVGPAQIMLRTAAQPGFGLPPLAEADRTDPAKAIPWAVRYLSALRDRLGDMPRALAAYNAGIGRVTQAEAAGSELPQETRNYLASLLPAAGIGAPIGLPPDEVHALARELRSDLAGAARQRRETQLAARADLEGRQRENMAAIAAQGRPVHDIGDDELLAAGFDVARVRGQERAAQYGFQAQADIRAATDPGHVADIAARFAPGTALFAADPQLVLGLLRDAQARGAQISHLALAGRLADLKARAEATGTAGAITAEEGAAAGLRPEQVAAANRDLALAAELTQLRTRAATMTGAEQLAAQQQLDFAGAEAAENRARLEALRTGWTERDRMLASDPAGYTAAGSDTARGMLDRIAGGEWAELPRLVAVLDAEQARYGLPADRRRPMPLLLAQALSERVLRLPGQGERLQTLTAMLAGLPDIDTRAQVLDAIGQAGVPEGLRIAAKVTPRIGTARASILATELGADISKIPLPPAFTKELRDNLPGFWNQEGGLFSSSRIGALRLAQAQATGNAAFAQAGAESWKVFERAATLRMLPGQGYDSSVARAVYDDLFGGQAVANTGQLKAVVPAGTDADKLASGLRLRLEAMARDMIPGNTPAAAGVRQAILDGTWTDAGAPDRFVFYPRGSALPLAVRGQPFVVTLPEALATHSAAGPAASADAIARRLFPELAR